MALALSVNSVNQMVADLKRRIDDGTDVERVKKPKKSRRLRIDAEISWPISIIVILAVGAILLFGISYLNKLQTERLAMEPQRFRIPAHVRDAAPIKMVKDGDKINIAKVERKPPVEKKTATAIGLSAHKLVRAEPPVKKDTVQKEINNSLNPAKKSEKITEKKTVATKKGDLTLAHKKASKKAAVKVKALATGQIAAVNKSKPVLAATAIKPQMPVSKPKLESVSVKKENSKKRKQSFDKTVVPLTDAELAEANYQRGIKLMDEGDISRAKGMFEKTLNEYPPHLKAREALAGIYINTQNWIKAEKTLVDGVKANKKNVSLSMWLAQVYLEQDKQVDAMNVLNENQKYAKDNGEYFALLAIVQQNLGKYDLSLEAYNKALETNSSVSRWWFGMAVVLELKNHWIDARAAYGQAIGSGQLTAELLEYANQRLDYVISQIELAELP